MVKRLHVVCNGHRMGEVEAEGSKLGFNYHQHWRELQDAFPLSLSMPLTAAEHSDRVVAPFLWNLLPDNDAILARWGRRFQVSPRNPFALLEHVGEDIAGAAQMVRPERLEEVLAGPPGRIDWLTEEQIGERLHDLSKDISAWSREGDSGYFSLSGAQPKMALLKRGERWGIPSGRVPTTHILKPPGGDFDGHAENEHFCLTLAGRLGLPVASSQVLRFAGHVAIVVQRFDRQSQGNQILRVPAEDACQSLAVHPARKYQNHGGPGAKELVTLLSNESSAREEDIATFLDALALNWLIGGTDAHAKNYSLLIGQRGRARLAPLYDIGSALAYAAFDPKRLKLAMKVGSHYEIKDVTARDWEKLAADAGVNGPWLRDRVAAMAQALPDHVIETEKELQSQGLKHSIVPRMTAGILEHIKYCALRMGKPSHRTRAM